MLYNKAITIFTFCILVFTTLLHAKNDTILLPKDTALTSIQQIINLSETDLREGRFNRSFEALRNTLPVAIQKADTSALLNIYKQLGILYGKFGQDSLANIHMKKALDISKQYQLSNNDSSLLLPAYFSLASLNAGIKNFDTALKYLDSCLSVTNYPQTPLHINCLYGQIFVQQGDFSKAARYYQKSKIALAKADKNFQVTNYYYLGELKTGLNERDSALHYYKKSLHIINSFGVHPMLKPTVLEKLARLSYSMNNKSEAYKYMQEAKLMSDSIFSIQSNPNKALFELRNKYNEDLIEKNKKIEAQERIIEYKDKASNRLLLLIGILVLSAVILFIYIRQRYKMKQILFKQTLNKEKNKDILEIKNKELAVNALQFIEKENTINELLEAIKASDTKKHKELNFKYKQNSKSLWDDFHSRFTQINDKFYKNLLALEPSFTPTELKHCALIKLNFDSKEMAQILGVAHNTIHMSRSRIRKKLNLSREDSLSNYISEI